MRFLLVFLLVSFSSRSVYANLLTIYNLHKGISNLEFSVKLPDRKFTLESAKVSVSAGTGVIRLENIQLLHERVLFDIASDLKLNGFVIEAAPLTPAEVKPPQFSLSFHQVSHAEVPLPESVTSRLQKEDGYSHLQLSEESADSIATRIAQAVSRSFDGSGLQFVAESTSQVITQRAFEAAVLKVIHEEIREQVLPELIRKLREPFILPRSLPETAFFGFRDGAIIGIGLVTSRDRQVNELAITVSEERFNYLLNEALSTIPRDQCRYALSGVAEQGVLKAVLSQILPVSKFVRVSFKTLHQVECVMDPPYQPHVLFQSNGDAHFVFNTHVSRKEKHITAEPICLAAVFRVNEACSVSIRYIEHDGGSLTGTQLMKYGLDGLINRSVIRFFDDFKPSGLQLIGLNVIGRRIVMSFAADDLLSGKR